MGSHATITVHRPPDELRRLWDTSEHRPTSVDGDAQVTFKPAPGDRGTEIHVDLGEGGLTAAVQRLAKGSAKAQVKSELRRFKQHVETGVIPRSDGAPEGGVARRQLKQQPAQPVQEAAR